MITSEFWVQTPTPYFLWLLPSHLYREKKRKRKRKERSSRVERGKRIGSNPTRDRDPVGSPISGHRFQSSLVPIGSPWAAGHLHVVFAVGKRPESHRSKSWEAAETPPRLATDCARRQSSINIFSAHWERGKTQPRLVLEPWKATETRSSAVFY